MFFRSEFLEEAQPVPTCCAVEVSNDCYLGIAEIAEPQLDQFVIGLTAFEAQDYEQARQALSLVPTENSVKYAWAQEWLGMTYMKLCLPELAIEHLQRALQLHERLHRDPLSLAECQFSLGLAYARTGHYEMALAEYRRVLKKTPDWSTVHFEEARVHAHRNRVMECVCALSRAAFDDDHYLERAARDPDFDAMRQMPEFQRLWRSPDQE